MPVCKPSFSNSKKITTANMNWVWYSNCVEDWLAVVGLVDKWLVIITMRPILNIFFGSIPLKRYSHNYSEVNSFATVILTINIHVYCSGGGNTITTSRLVLAYQSPISTLFSFLFDTPSQFDSHSWQNIAPNYQSTSRQQKHDNTMPSSSQSSLHLTTLLQSIKGITKKNNDEEERDAQYTKYSTVSSADTCSTSTSTTPTAGKPTTTAARSSNNGYHSKQ